MKNAEMIKKRRDLLDMIIGEWESYEFHDSQSNQICKIIFQINNHLCLTENLTKVEATKLYIKKNSSETIVIKFNWINIFLEILIYEFGKGIIAITPDKEEFGLYRYNPELVFNNDNLIIKFKKKQNLFF